MSARDDGGPAFPVEIIDKRGMSLRDWFAGQALAECLAKEDPSTRFDWQANSAVKNAYYVADAMLAQRSKP